MASAYILVGIPGAGKSTWVSSQNFDRSTVIISADAHIEKYAISVGRAYDEVFKQFSSAATTLMMQDLRWAIENGLSIVWDQTSTTVASRRKKLQEIPKSYSRVAVVFETPAANELNRRLASRPGKSIPPFVVKKLIDNMELPTLHEGFHKIIKV